MKIGDKAFTPQIAFYGTKATIEAWAGAVDGMEAVATDTLEKGVYASGAWKWSALSGLTAAQITDLTDGGETTLHTHASSGSVTGGDSHDHSGGDGAQVNHTTLSNIGSNTHAQIDTFISTTAPATYAPIAQGVTNGDSHNHSGGDGAQIAYSALSGLPTISTGTYTPTLYNTTNIDSSVAAVCSWMRIDDMVVVSGKVTINPTAAGVIVLGMEIPIASNFAGATQLGGASAAWTISQPLACEADVTNDRAKFSSEVSDTSSKNYSFIFMYRIV